MLHWVRSYHNPIRLLRSVAVKIIYFNCGHNDDGITEQRRKRGSIVCPKCGEGRGMAVKVQCQVCGDVVFVPMTVGDRRKYCDICQDVVRRRMVDEYNKDIRYYSHPQAQTRHHDCQSYDSCLTRAALENVEFGCGGCDRYEKATMDVLDYQYVRGDLEPA